MTTLTKNIVALQKGLLIPKGVFYLDNTNLVATLQSKLMQLGYMLSKDAFAILSANTTDFIINYSNEVIPYLTNILGGSRNFTPLYKNFPQEVMDKDDCEIFVNAILHYWSEGTFEPFTDEKYTKTFAFENVKYEIINLGNEEDFDNIFKNIVSINTSLIPNDMEIIKWFVNDYKTFSLPKEIPFKETLCFLGGLGVENLPVKTTTDVLRIAVAMSGGDTSLPKVPPKMVKQIVGWGKSKKIENVERDKFKFRNFKRSERRYILSLLESTNCDVKEMVLKDQRWIRLGERLHPMEYKKQFPKSANAFNLLRNTNIKSWYSELEKAFDISLSVGLLILSERPGEFVRRIDWLVRTYQNDLDLILNKLKLVLKRVSNKVLFEVYTHFENRLVLKKHRSIFTKGSRKPTELPNLEPLDKDLVSKILNSLLETLKEKFSYLDNLGVCYVDEELKKIPLPTNMRSLSKSSRPIIRGQRISFDNKEIKTVRFFYHWVDINGEFDPDLSATFINEDDRMEVLSYSTTGLKVGKSCHSGDIVARVGNNAEYVDIDINNAISLGFRYVSLDVRNYRGGKLSDMEGRFGIQERDFPESNDNWQPDTLTNTFLLTSDSTTTLICFIDLFEKEYIYLDVDNDKVMASNSINDTLKIVKQYTELPKISVYDLIMWHIESRGEIVENLTEDVENHFKYEDFIHSYEKTALLMGV